MTMQHRFLSLLSAIVLAGPAPSHAGSSPGAATTATVVCDRTAGMDGLQRRLVAKAGDGADALRNFVQRTRAIYALDFNEIVAWLDGEREAEAACVAAARQPLTARR